MRDPIAVLIPKLLPAGLGRLPASSRARLHPDLRKGKLVGMRRIRIEEADGTFATLTINGLRSRTVIVRSANFGLLERIAVIMACDRSVAVLRQKLIERLVKTQFLGIDPQHRHSTFWSAFAAFFL